MGCRRNLPASGWRETIPLKETNARCLHLALEKRLTHWESGMAYGRESHGHGVLVVVVGVYVPPRRPGESFTGRRATSVHGGRKGRHARCTKPITVPKPSVILRKSDIGERCAWKAGKHRSGEGQAEKCRQKDNSLAAYSSLPRTHLLRRCVNKPSRQGRSGKFIVDSSPAVRVRVEGRKGGLKA